MLTATARRHVGLQRDPRPRNRPRARATVSEVYYVEGPAAGVRFLSTACTISGRFRDTLPDSPGSVDGGAVKVIHLAA